MPRLPIGRRFCESNPSQTDQVVVTTITAAKLLTENALNQNICKPSIIATNGNRSEIGRIAPCPTLLPHFRIIR
jgi:hypothetical protein